MFFGMVLDGIEDQPPKTLSKKIANRNHLLSILLTRGKSPRTCLESGA
ncbi:hypothetical protein Sarmat_00633 [Rickettsiales endosymbiont of Paramecium tredecaurelia]|nr:hypothetical protein [Candidatus Sarmatiella mevalonica]